MFVVMANVELSGHAARNLNNELRRIRLSDRVPGWTGRMNLQTILATNVTTRF